MRIAVDIDNTITVTTGNDYANAIPLHDKIEIVNSYYDAGHYVYYYTGRGWDKYDMTYQWLVNNGCKFHVLLMGKPLYDIFFDDRSERSVKIIPALYN